MIPPFDESGSLPPGIHPATLAEIEARFGVQSEVRRVQMESVRWMVDLAVRAGAERIVLNGSFVTDIIEPNDVDCVLLFRRGGCKDLQALQELRDGVPFVGITVAFKKEFDRMINRVFASDRHGTAKGMVEVVR